MWNRASGEVYLEGELERGVVPEECFWTHCGGEGEDGCALYLRKMNLELLQRCGSGGSTCSGCEACGIRGWEDGLRGWEDCMSA